MSETSNGGSVQVGAPKEYQELVARAVALLSGITGNLDAVGYGDAADEVASALGHLEVARKIMSVGDED